MSGILSAAVKYVVEHRKFSDEHRKFDSHSDWIEAMAIDSALYEIVLLDAADLLRDGNWSFPRLLGADVSKDCCYAKFVCEMGGGNRECTCEKEHDDDDDDVYCWASEIKHLRNHHLFISDKDEYPGSPFNIIKFGPLNGPVPDLTFYAIQNTGKKRVYECPGCKARLLHAGNAVELWQNKVAVADWFATHRQCAKDD